MNDLTAAIHTRPERTSLLRRALTLDAAVTAANGLAYLVAAAPLEDLLGLSSSLLRGVGAFLLAYAAFVGLTATRTAISRPATWAIVFGNGLWACASAVAALAAWGSPTTAGTVWIVLQAMVVAGFAELQVAGLSQARR